MILRRLSDAIRRQDWFTVVIETLIVVFGVYIGLQVNNWAQDRADRRDYNAALERLRDEIAANRETMDMTDSDLAAELPRVRGALDALETCADDPATLAAVNDGISVFFGTNGIKFRTDALDELTASPRLLAQQPRAVRSRLSDLRFYQQIAQTQADGYEARPQTVMAERIPVLTPGPRQPFRATFLGIVYEGERRPMRLRVPVSEACRNADLVAAFWKWDRLQSNLPILTAKMRAEYDETLRVIEDSDTR